MEEDHKKKFHQGELYDAYKYFGCQYNCAKKCATFRVFAPSARKVNLIGEFNNWDEQSLPMENEGGVFSISLKNVNEFDGYKYRIETADGRVLYKTDPYALHTETETLTNSKVYPLSKIRIRDKKYQESLKSRDKFCSPMNIYEAHVGSWRRYPDGKTYTYRHFADEIVPYLKKMNYTHLELIGVSEHPYDGSWGYQVTGFFAPTSRFGTPADFCYLVSKLHANGIGIIIDWVPGHFSKNENGLYEFDGTCLYEPSDELNREHKQWGTRCFDYGKGEVQSFLCSSAMMWLELYKVDGLRVDAVASMLYLDYQREHGLWTPNRFGGRENEQAVAFLQKLNTYVKKRLPHAMIIAEESTSWKKITGPVDEGGLGFDYKWNMGWMNDVLDYVKIDPFFRVHHHDKLTFSLTYAFDENFVLPISHDEVVHGKLSLIGRMPGEYDNKFAGLRNFLMNMYAHPGKKLLMMGCEFGQFIEWDYRKELDWLLLAYDRHKEMQEFTARLNAIYKKTPALWEQDGGWGGFEWLVVDDKSQNVIVYQRKDKSGNILIAIINFSPNEYKNYRFGVTKKGVYEQILYTKLYGVNYDKVKLKTERVASHGKDNSIVLDIPPLAGIYLIKNNRGKKK